MDGKKIIGGAACLGAAAILTKLLGAIYRVPLTNVIGGFGLGLYQTVFPVYALLLDFSGAGAPTALSKLISSYSGEEFYLNAERHLNTALKVFSVIGAIGSFLMAALSFPIASAQGNGEVWTAYLTLAPSVFAVAVISCYRGYFQGCMNMVPTAVSQITEQVVKLAFGLLFAHIFMSRIPLAVAGATFAISLSELITLTYLYVRHKRAKSKRFPNGLPKLAKERGAAKKLLAAVVPITFIGVMIPFSQVLDSFLTVNILSGYRADATALYGLLSGVAATVAGLPVSVCYGVAAVAVPAVSSAKGKNEKEERAAKVMLLTALIAAPCAIALWALSPLAVGILFPRLSAAEKFTAAELIKFLSPSVFTLSLLQTENAVLIGKGKFLAASLSLLSGVAVKTLLNIFLLSDANLNIFGGAVAVNACYFLPSLINLIVIFRSRMKDEARFSRCGEYSHKQ